MNLYLLEERSFELILHCALEIKKQKKQKNKVELEMSIPANDINDQKDDDKKKYGCYNS